MSRAVTFGTHYKSPPQGFFSTFLTHTFNIVRISSASKSVQVWRGAGTQQAKATPSSRAPSAAAAAGARLAPLAVFVARSLSLSLSLRAHERLVKIQAAPRARQAAPSVWCDAQSLSNAEQTQPALNRRRRRRRQSLVYATSTQYTHGMPAKHARSAATSSFTHTHTRARADAACCRRRLSRRRC